MVFDLRHSDLWTFRGNVPEGLNRIIHHGLVL